MNIVLNETFEREGVDHGPFRVFVATNVVAKMFEADDDIFDVVYYFGKVSEDEDVEARLYWPRAQGSYEMAISRVSFSLEDALRVQTGEAFRMWRHGEQDVFDYPATGHAAVYLKRADKAFWACMVNGLGRPEGVECTYAFSDQKHENGVMSTRDYAWETLAQLADQAQLFGLFGPVEGSHEISIVDRPGLLGMRSSARAG